MKQSEYNKVSKGWRGHVYQTWDRCCKRIEVFETIAPLFEKHKVLELGSNAGLYGYIIGKYADEYIGVEMGKTWHRQAKYTHKRTKAKTTLVNATVKEFLKRPKRPQFDALFASYALYHFSDKEVLLLSKKVLPKCSLAIIQTRTKKKTPWRMYNKYKFWKPDNVAKWLRNAGFECEITWAPSKKFAEVIGVRPKDEQAALQTTGSNVARGGVSRATASNEAVAVDAQSGESTGEKERAGRGVQRRDVRVAHSASGKGIYGNRTEPNVLPAGPKNDGGTRKRNSTQPVVRTMDDQHQTTTSPDKCTVSGFSAVSHVGPRDSTAPGNTTVDGRGSSLEQGKGPQHKEKQSQDEQAKKRDEDAKGFSV